VEKEEQKSDLLKVFLEKKMEMQNLISGWLKFFRTDKKATSSYSGRPHTLSRINWNDQDLF
jgi:hypothetical protein